MAPSIPFCDTPGQSALVGMAGGLLGGIAGIALGLDTVGVAVLAGVLGGGGDLGAHLLRRDEQFEAALAALR